MNKSLFIEDTYQAELSCSIQKEYNAMRKQICGISFSLRSVKNIHGTGGLVSVNDLIAYQIGWCKRLISWYEAGIKGEVPVMPGDGFSAWKYTEIAQSFYRKYHYDGFDEQDKVFNQCVVRIIEIAELEYTKGMLDKTGVWPWMTLASGKQWPLSKWMQVNTVAPFKRAAKLLKDFCNVARD